MAGGAALAPSSLPPPAPAPSQQQQNQQHHAKEQLQKAVAMNALRLQAIGDRIKGHFRGGPNSLPPSDLNHLVYAFARFVRLHPPAGPRIVPRLCRSSPAPLIPRVFWPPRCFVYGATLWLNFILRVYARAFLQRDRLRALGRRCS